MLPPPPLCSRSPYECIKFAYPLKNARFLLLSTNLAWQRLQIDRDLLLIITCWRPFRGYQHRRPWTTLKPKNSVFSEFFAIVGCDTHLKSEFTPKLLEIDQYHLMLSRVSWALALISCCDNVSCPKKHGMITYRLYSPIAISYETVTKITAAMRLRKNICSC